MKTLKERVLEVEKAAIEEALRQFGGKRTEAAAHLGISRKNLWEKMLSHGIVFPLATTIVADGSLP